MTRCRGKQPNGNGCASSPATTCEFCLEELAEIVGGELRLASMPPLGGDCEPVDRVVFDAYQAGPRDVFWETPTTNGSSRPRAEQAFSRGALAAIVQRGGVEPWAGRCVIEVCDARQSLWQLASWMREHYTGKIVAVAGRLGKSTAHAMIAHVLRQHLASVTPVDDESDCPALEALIQLQSQPDCGLVELPGGASDQAASLAQLARPHVLVLLGNDRPGSTPWQEAAPPTDECWESLLDSLADDGVAIVDGDDPALCRAAAERRQQTVLVGRGSHCDLIVRDVDGGGDGLSLQVDGVRLRVPVWGRHHVAAASSALAVCRALRVSDRRIAAALAQFTPLAGRCQVVASRPVTVIDDTHRAGWTDTRAALAALRDTPTHARRVVLLGPIACQADDAEILHRAVGAMVVTLAGAGLLVAFGPHADAVVDGARHAGMRDGATLACFSADEALTATRSRLRHGDVVLVKGSRATGIDRIAASLAATQATGRSEQVRTRIERRTPMPGLAPSENVEASPLASVMREAGATLPPG